MQNFNEKIENIFNEEKIKSSFGVEYGIIDKSDVDDFYDLIKQDFKGLENDNKLDLDKIEKFISEKYWSSEETFYFNKLIPKVLNKLILDQKIKLESKILLEKEIEELSDFVTGNKKVENRSGNNLSYEVLDKVKHVQEISGKEKLSNRKLTEIILPKRFSENNSFFEINFDILKEKTPESFSKLLQEIFNNLSEKELYILNGIITGIQANGFGLNSKILNLGLKDFLEKKFPKYLQDAKKLSKSELEKDKILLKGKKYWIIRNLLQLTEISGKIETKTGKEKLNIGTFSPGGSYGPIYLGQLHKQYKENTLPDLYIGASAGSLYPTLFLLWNKALEKDKNSVEKLTGINGDSLESLISLIPKKLDNSKSMFWDGEELIDSFFDVFKKLVKIIYPNKNIDFENLTFNDLDLPIIAVSSYEYQDKNYVPGLFTNDDNIKKSIITSSNPEINVLGFDINILTNDNKIYGNDWNDGDHSLKNPIEMAYLLNYNMIYRYQSFYSFEGDTNRSDKINILAPLEKIRLDDISQGNGFDLDNAKFLSIVGNIGKISIYSLYDLLLGIKNSTISNKNKTYYKNKLIQILLKKRILDSLFKKQINNFDKVKTLLNSDLITKEEKNNIIKEIINNINNHILKQVNLLKNIKLNGKSNENVVYNIKTYGIDFIDNVVDQIIIDFSIDIFNNKEFYIFYKNNPEIQELFKELRKVFNKIIELYQPDTKVVKNAKKCLEIIKKI